MKKLTQRMLLLAAASVLATGCMMPGYQRLIPANKDAHLMVYSPIYGWAVIDTRVPGSPAKLPPLPTPVVVPTPPPTNATVVVTPLTITP